MDIKTLIQKIKSNDIIRQHISIVCDMDIYDELTEPENAGGRVTYSINGKAFARDGSGGEYILLDDGSVAYNGSEGQAGRIAENFDEFLTLIINCSCFLDYTDSSLYKDKDKLKKLSDEMESNFAKDIAEYLEVPFFEAKQKIAKLFGVNLYENISESVLLMFYKAAEHEPKFLSFFHEKDGSKTVSNDLVI